MVITIAAGFGVGVLAALFGVGGGLLMVPFMVLVLERTQHVAEGTSLLVIVPTAVVGVIAHARRGLIEWQSVGYLALGGIVGAVFGALIALRVPARTLEFVFGFVVIAIGARFVVQGVTATSGSDTGEV